MAQKQPDFFDLEMTELFKEITNNPFYKNDKGMNWLHLALQPKNYNLNSPTIIQFILDTAIDPNEVDMKMKTSFDYAEELNNIYITHLLNEYINVSSQDDDIYEDDLD